jgi:homoserine kinase
MRTTLDIDDDVLAVARAQAARKRTSIGQVLSSLARSALQPSADTAIAVRNGIPLLQGVGSNSPVTLELVNLLRDELP